MNLVVCIGSETGNDSFGFRVAEKIEGKVNARVEKVANYIDILTFLYDEDYSRLIVVDAVKGNGDYKLVEFDVKAEGEVRAILSHSVSFFDSMRLAKALEILPEKAIVIGMEVRSYEVDEKRLAKAVELASKRVLEICGSRN